MEKKWIEKTQATMQQKTDGLALAKLIVDQDEADYVEFSKILESARALIAKSGQ